MKRKGVGDEPAGVGDAPTNCSRVKPSLEPRKVEGPDCITKAKNGTGKREAIRAKPRDEARFHPESLEKCPPYLHWITLASVFRICA
jgi:hypothetical protein